MSLDPGTPTFDQLRVFLAVFEAGSFAGAARKLGRATSVVSYSIANLEDQLGFSLFDRESTRRPQLTDAGRTVLSDARTVANGMDGLRAKARGLLHGLEGEIRLVLDAMLPAARVVDALKALRANFPTVSLHLHVEALGAVTERVLDGRATLGVCVQLDKEVAGLERIGIGSVDLVPVAAPDHPLARAGRNGPGAGREHLQLVLTDRSTLTQGDDRGVIGTQTWRLADLHAKHTFLREGIGWGYMPEPMVLEDIGKGRLVRLDMPEWKHGSVSFYAIHRTDKPPGPAGSALIARFAGQVVEDEEAGARSTPSMSGKRRKGSR